ncbi:MAG: pyridoxamine 5'-phosphate oxidase family protein, partial [Ilumatobacteraceae bacterium]
MSADPLAELARHRFDYETAGLDVADVDVDPTVQWQRWYREAGAAGCTEPNAFVLGTVDEQGWPQSRYLLLRGADDRGFTFFTNYDSAKSRELAATGRASMLF